MSFCFNEHQMKIITIKQPEANMIINGLKNIENKTRKIKLSQNFCKNWLLVHSASKPRTWLKQPTPPHVLDNCYEPTSSIIGIIHIHSIKKKGVQGLYCWYIDAIIKFKNIIKTMAKMRQGLTWNPYPELHVDIEKEIKNSMFQIVPLDNIEFHLEGGIYYVIQRGEYMTWENVIKSLREDIDTFKYKLIKVLLSIEYKAYFWECDKVVLKNPFRFTIFDSKTLSERKQDLGAFKGKINDLKLTN